MARSSLEHWQTCENWFTIGLDSLRLGSESVAVIALRSAKLAVGGVEAWHEAHRIVAEKSLAPLSFGIALAAGEMGNSPQTFARGTVAHYRRKVRANRRRLTRG